MKAMTVGELSEWLASNKVDRGLPLEVIVERQDADGNSVNEDVCVTGCELTASAYSGAVRLEVEL